MNVVSKISAFVMACAGVFMNQVAHSQTITPVVGLSGYIIYRASNPPPGYGAGMSFYTAVWPLSEDSLSNFQFGLAGSWILPDNRDNTTTALAPPGSLARISFPNGSPTWDFLFQTLEGGVGYWNLNHYSNGQPKFSMNSTPQCYDYEVATPGWNFFYSPQALPDNRLGIAQLSNRILIPPDAMPFAGNPNGEFLGYSYMALPFTDAVPANLPAGEPPTGDQSWTCFLNSSNFKGPIAFFIPETWSKIGKVYDYPFIHGRGLDARAGIAGAGAMEIGQVPGLESVDSQGVKYCKLPKLQYPVDEFSRTLLVQDVTFYSKSALFDSFKAWRDGGQECSGIFNSTGAWKPTLSRVGPIYTQNLKGVIGVENVFDNKVYPGDVWGLEWKSSAISPKGIFPQYFKEIGQQRVAIPAASVPSETGLLTAQFPKKRRDQAYTSPTTGDTWAPQGRVGPFTTYLLDGSKVTYYWYRFIDQPSFKQYAWSAQKRAALQAHVEKIHTSWPTNRDYMAPPTTGVLATMDPSLLVTPPRGLEVGYVPIVTRQEDIGDTTPPTPSLMSFAIDPHLLGADSITMTATTASDAFGPVSYYFENTTTGKTSGWISSPVWTDKVLSTGTNYSYRVKAHDTSQNETSWSAEVTILPVITALSPADDATEVELDAPVTATFGRAITTGSGFITLKNLTDGTQSQINIADTSRISIAGKVLTIDPAADLVKGKSYAIRIDSTAIKDLWNSPFGGIGNDTTWNFKMAGAGTISSGGTITYTDVDGLNPRSSPPYLGGYVVHTFSSSGALVVTTGVNVECLLVAGGGGGATKHGGGGGAGGLVLGSTQVTAQSHPITVGIGGAGGNSSEDELKAGISGLNSRFGPFTAIGGGGGRTYGGAATGGGGSGGGGAGALNNISGGSGTAGQGNAGGSGSESASGSGGGGAGQPGAKGTPGGGKGGDGVTSAISGITSYYAGGGGGGGDDPVLGGIGGLGGGGHGGDNATSDNQTSGVAGTGGGGGGCRGTAVAQTGSAGGSGIVIIRYVFPAPQLVRSAIIDDKNGGPVTVNTPVTYTVTFTEDMDAASVTAADFSNAGTAIIMVQSVVETAPGVFTVRVTPTSVGTLQLQVPMGAVLRNPAGNPVNTRAAILDTTILNVVTSTFPTGYILDFTENFSGNSSGPNMTLVTSPDSPATSFNGAFTIASSPGSRIYLGTNKKDYSKADFIFEADVTIPNLTNAWSIPFIGMGKATGVVADNCYGEPLTIPHVLMLVRNDENRLIARDNSQTALASDFAISNVPITVGTHRLRMSWMARTQIATFSIDLGNDGNYDFTFPVDGSNNGFNTTNSQLLLGGGNGVSFDNISILVQDASSPLKITSIIRTGATVNVGFEGVAGLTYDLNKSTSLNFTAPNIKSTTTLTGTTLGTLQDTSATEPAAFYRVEPR